MKFNQAILALLALASAAVGAPAAAADSPNAATAQSQDQIEWTGDSTHLLSARAKKGRGERCTVGKGQCQSGLGCFGCLGHQPVCQEGPGSNQCCFEDDRGRRCEVLPIGK